MWFTEWDFPILEEEQDKPRKNNILFNIKVDHAEREIEQARQNLAKEEQELDTINHRLANVLDTRIKQFMDDRGIGEN